MSTRSAARQAAHTLHAKVDPARHTEPARAAAFERFRQQVLADSPELAGNQEEIDRRARHLRRARMTELSRKAAQGRRPNARIDEIVELLRLAADALEEAGH